jgi:hypothetical protein
LTIAQVAVRADEIRTRGATRDRARVEHERALEAERRRAHERAVEAHRVEILQNRLERWRAARELRAYLADRTAAVDRAELDPADLSGPREWLAGVADHIEWLDPHDGLPTLPEPRRLPDHELQKYMRHVQRPDGFHFVETDY